MKMIKLKDESKRIIGIVAEGYDAEIRFTRYYINEYGVYISEILVEEVDLDDCYASDIGEKTKSEYRKIRLENIRREAEMRFPTEKKVYYTE